MNIENILTNSKLNMKEVGDMYRIITGKTVAEMAKDLGKSANTIYQFEAGTQKCELLRVFYVAKYDELQMYRIFDTIKSSRALARLNSKLGGI